MEDSEQKILWFSFCCCCKHTVLIMLIKCKSMQKKHKLCSSVTDVFLLELVCFISDGTTRKKDRTLVVGFIPSFLFAPLY